MGEITCPSFQLGIHHPSAWPTTSVTASQRSQQRRLTLLIFPRTRLVLVAMRATLDQLVMLAFGRAMQTFLTSPRPRA
jgi:hypothetical protein